MRTYADVLKGENMADYLKDEQDRQERRRIQEEEEKRRTDINKEEEPWRAVNIELKDDDFMKIAQEAHKRDITFNKMCNIILKRAIKDAEYRFEHGNDKQLLKEY